MPEHSTPQEKSNLTQATENLDEKANSEVENRLDRLEKYIAAIAEPIIKRKDPNRSLWERAADGFENHPFSRLAIGLGAMLAVFSLIGVTATALGVWFQYQSATEERIARAWQTLSSDAPGNSGKGKAIEFLHKQDARLVGINIGGTSKLDGTYISNLELQNAMLDRPNLNFGELSEISFNKVYITWAKANNAFIKGEFKDVDILWSELIDSTFGLYYESKIDFRYDIADGLYLNTDYLEYASDYEPGSLSAESLTKIYPKLSFTGSSLRCASLSYYPITSFNFEDVDISGSHFDFSDFRDSPSHEAAWGNLKGAWYYSDNPPLGVPPEHMEKYLFSRDRQTVLGICNKHEPRAFREDPLGELNGPDGIEMACVSLARRQDKCVLPDPLSPYARINSLYHNPEEYGLEQ